MSSRNQALTTVKGGINRQRTKGAALADSLYDLLNGYVTKARTVVVRPGTFRHAHLSVDTLVGTHGLVSFDGTLHIFSASVIPVPAGFTLHVLQHPTDPTQDIVEIHFGAPFLGFLYVVAEFTNGDVFHFWLQTTGAWTASTVYKAGDSVTPTVPNGLVYVAERLAAARPLWAAGAKRALNDEVEPTTANGYYEVVTSVQGDTPASGTVEPTWLLPEGAITIEDVATTPVGTNDVAPTTPAQTPDSNVTDRYGTFP